MGTSSHMTKNIQNGFMKDDLIQSDTHLVGSYISAKDLRQNLFMKGIQ